MDGGETGAKEVISVLAQKVTSACNSNNVILIIVEGGSILDFGSLRYI